MTPRPAAGPAVAGERVRPGDLVGRHTVAVDAVAIVLLGREHVPTRAGAGFGQFVASQTKASIRSLRGSGLKWTSGSTQSDNASMRLSPMTCRARPSSRPKKRQVIDSEFDSICTWPCGVTQSLQGESHSEYTQWHLNASTTARHVVQISLPGDPRGRPACRWRGAAAWC
jgi:hypothetical protein